MSKREVGLGLLLALSLTLTWCEGSAKDDALERAETLEAALPALTRQRDSAQAVATNLARQAALSDSVAEAVRDSADAIVRGAQSGFRGAVDTLRVLVTDTTALRMIDRMEADHAAALEAERSKTEAERQRAELWRASSLARDSVIAQWERRDELRDGIESALREHISGERRRNLKSDAVAFVVGVGACLVAC